MGAVSEKNEWEIPASRIRNGGARGTHDISAARTESRYLFHPWL